MTDSDARPSGEDDNGIDPEVGPDDEEKRTRNDERLRVQRELNALIRQRDYTDDQRSAIIEAEQEIADGRYRDAE